MYGVVIHKNNKLFPARYLKGSAVIGHILMRTHGKFGDKDRFEIIKTGLKLLTLLYRYTVQHINVWVVSVMAIEACNLGHGTTKGNVDAQRSALSIAKRIKDGERMS